MKVSYCSITDPGVTRDHNEDFFLNDDKYSLLMVADGMGGYQAGDVASKTALSAIIEYLDICSNQSGKFSLKSYEAAITYANEKVFKYREKIPEIDMMGTTFVAFVHSETGGKVFNIGDSRLYIYSNKNLSQITKDHNAQQELLPDFMQNAGDGKYASVLSRALGATEKVYADIFDVEYNQDDILLLCSDGLYSMMSDSDMQEILASDISLNEKCSSLVKKANDNGGEDNITVTLIQLDDVTELSTFQMVK